MDEKCEFTTQGIYACYKKNNKESEKKNKCGDGDNNTILKYNAADIHYDMNMRAMLYQLRATETGYKMYSLQEKKKNNS